MTMNSLENLRSSATSSEADAAVRAQEVSLLASGFRKDEINYDELRRMATLPEGTITSSTQIHAREIHADVPQSRSLFQHVKGFLGREGVVMAPPVWTESAEDYNARIDAAGMPEEFSDAERDMAQPGEAALLASGAHPSNINYYSLLDTAYSEQEMAEGKPNAALRTHTQILARPIYADPGVPVIHRDGPPPLPPQQ
jgi:hypothetical protein